ncbi:hypothetical protein VTG60DRAFT_1817 [Thermothelomyces hinnuleus]
MDEALGVNHGWLRTTDLSLKEWKLNFNPFLQTGTVEFRLQGGVVSAKTAMRRVLLALNLHLSPLQYGVGKAVAQMGNHYPKVDALKAELWSTL